MRAASVVLAVDAFGLQVILQTPAAPLAAVPGLAEHIEHATGIAPVRLDPLAPARGALAQATRIAVPGAGLAHVTRLGGIARRDDPATHLAGPTHVLVGDRALPVPSREGDAMLPLSHLRSGLPGALRLLDGRLWVDGAAEESVVLNGKPARLPLRVGIGDRVEIGGTLLRLIEVVGT